MRAGAWSAEEFLALRELARDRSLTAAQVMKLLNARFGNQRSRNAVLGAIHRLGLGIGQANLGTVISAKRRRALKEPAPPRMPRVLAARKPPMPDPIIPPPKPPPPPPRPPFSVADLTINHCRWIEGSPQAERPFECAETAVNLKPYCPAHMKRAFNPSPRFR